MGFKCPFCKKDFGQDKKEFDLHIKSHDEPIHDLKGLAYINSTDSVKNILEKRDKEMSNYKLTGGGTCFAENYRVKTI